MYWLFEFIRNKRLILWVRKRRKTPMLTSQAMLIQVILYLYFTFSHRRHCHNRWLGHHQWTCPLCANPLIKYPIHLRTLRLFNHLRHRQMFMSDHLIQTILHRQWIPRSTFKQTNFYVIVYILERTCTRHRCSMVIIMLIIQENEGKEMMR